MNPRVKSALRAARRSVEQISNRLDGYDPVGSGNIPKALKVCTDEACRLCRADGTPESALRITYLLPSDNLPSGGNKVSYREIELISNEGVSCFAFHAEKPGTSYSWFPHRVRTLPVGHFDPRRDFLVIPEVWAALGAKFCVPAGLRYALFVQNGYLAHESAGFGQSALRDAYRNAALILSISTHTTEILSLLYPFVPQEKVLRLCLSVPSLFAPSPKERSITYMPRKLHAHSERLCLYLRNWLPDGWRLQAIEGLDERGVAASMSRSSVFLSFSDLEGYGLPPLEAALAGNIVVGYTGQAGKEYFGPPIFREVPTGDFLLYVTKVRAAIEDAERGVAQSEAFARQLKQLADAHSVVNEIAHLRTFVDRVRELMGVPAGLALPTCGHSRAPARQ
jgi:glycosyltransferase involved in cell wall biosynthesis